MSLKCKRCFWRHLLKGGVNAAYVEVERRLDAAASAVELRDAYDVSPHEFRVAPIGKDGGVKLRQDQPILAADLFALIDSMPMRKQEMCRRRGEFVNERDANMLCDTAPATSSVC